MRLISARIIAALCAMAPTTACAGADDATAFFESRIRPVLVEHCYKCHSGRYKVAQGRFAPGQPRSPVARRWQRAGDRAWQARRQPAHQGAQPRGRGRRDAPGREIAGSGTRRLSPLDRLGRARPSQRGPRGHAAGRRRCRVRPRAWAFRPPRHHAAPSVRDTSWATNEVDRFVLARLEAQELRPAPDADRYTWLRRIAIDLVGLPPSPEQLVAFVNDPSPRARERVVDRLLASPAFGERWARHWLDLTGYADQIGTANDIFAEHAWRYRDYVIAAFNADMPFDRFIREQLAGDLLPFGTADERARN